MSSLARAAGPVAQLGARVRAFSGLRTAGEMGGLAVTTIRLAATPPFPWVRDSTVEAALAFRRCLVPLLLSLTPYTIGYIVFYFGGILDVLGATERLGGGVYVASIREQAVWITAMVFAGIAGSAVASDLGARKIRDELDALAVLGVERVRALVVPRVVAMTVMPMVLGMLALMFTMVLTYVVAPGVLGFQPAVFRHSVVHSILPIDIAAFMVKLALTGFLVGIISCQKGLGASGGAEGVGRAVNQTVVICFVGIWVINSLFNLAFLSLFPETSVLRG